jgi:carbonic anhydrase
LDHHYYYSYGKHRTELDAIADPDKRHRRLVDLNVIQQCVNIMKTGVVQARRAETWQQGEPYTSPLVHAMVFDPKSGDLKRVDVDFESYADELTNVYGLYRITV